METRRGMRRALIKRNAPSFPSCVYLSIPRVFRVYADHLRALFFPSSSSSSLLFFSFVSLAARQQFSLTRQCHRADTFPSWHPPESWYSWWFAARATANLHAACDGATRLILVPCDRRGNLYRRDLGCAVFLLDLGMKKEIFGYNIGWV